MGKLKKGPATNGRNRIAGLAETIENGAQKASMLKIPEPRMKVIKIRIIGTAPYMQLRFSQKAMNTMMANMEAGSQAKSKRVRTARDFDDDYQQAFHRLPDGSAGIPAAAIRAGCVSACRMVGFKMTVAKLSIFCEADGLDVVDGTPLVRIHGKPEKTILPVRNANGNADLRVRPMWREWHADITIRFNEDQFSAQDAINLIAHVGCSVGIGEGRPDSKESCGMGYGLFRLEGHG